MSLCERCHEVIAETPEDPLVITALGRMHLGCMREAWAERRRMGDARRAELHERRSLASKAAYEKRKDKSDASE